MKSLQALAATAVGKQVGRFVRLFVPLLIAQLAAVPGHSLRSTLLAAVPGALEVAYRQWRPGAVAAVVGVTSTNPAVTVTPPKQAGFGALELIAVVFVVLVVLLLLHRI